MHPAINQLTAPGQRRPGIFRGGIIQVMITRSCDLACFGCSAGSNLVSHTGVMSVDQFAKALDSLEGYWGVIACFGGNPCLHPKFGEICEVMRGKVPFIQRGLWTNNLMGNGKVARITFNPKYSNVNVHMSEEAYAEFDRDWPEALTARGEHTLRSLNEDSVHGTPWVSPTDLGIPEEERWKYIADCDISRWWSAIICLVRGELRGFFCEIAGHMAALHGDNPDWAGTGQPMLDIGLPVVPGWWREPMASFEEQVKTCCHHCAIPLRREGQLAIGGNQNEFSKAHEHIGRLRRRDQQVVEIGLGEWKSPRSDRPATNYLPGTTPEYHGK